MIPLVARRASAFLLGAGFSYELGMPLVWELTKELTDWLTPAKFRELNGCWADQGGGYPDATLRFMDQLLTEDLHYEQLIGRAQDRFLKTQQQHDHHLVGWLTETVLHILYLRHKNNYERIRERTDWYRGFSKLALESPEPLTVFSLNHDLCVELICERFGVPWSNGVDQDTVTVRQHNERPEPRISFQCAPVSGLTATSLSYIEQGPGMNLIKLHGGLDMFRHDDGKLLAVIPPSTESFDRVACLTAIYEDSSFTRGGPKAKAIGEVVLGDDAGAMQFFRHTLLSGHHKFSKQLSQNAPEELLDVFVELLNKWQCVTIVGYSFGDPHINQIIAHWFAADTARHVVIVDPARADVPHLLAADAGRVTLIQLAATAFFDAMADIERGRRDLAQMRVARSLRAMSDHQGRAEAIRRAHDAFIANVAERLVARFPTPDDMNHVDPDTLACELIGTDDDVIEFLADNLHPDASSSTDGQDDTTE